MYKYWYDYAKPEYGEIATLYYMDTDSFIINKKIKDTYVDIAIDVEARFVTSNYELDRLLPKEKNWKITRLRKDELGGKIMREFASLRAKRYGYLSF